MGPQDHLRAFLDGFECTVCDEHVPADGIRLLARRDDLLFLQVACIGCGSTALAFITDEGIGHRTQQPEVDRLAGAAAITSDDVLEMHAFLESWTGDLVSLIGGPAVARALRTGPRDGGTGRPR